MNWNASVTFEKNLKFPNTCSKSEIKKLILHTAKTTLESAKPIYKIAGLSDISIHIVSDKSSHKLNLEYRQKDKPTDVLSFSAIEGGAIPGLTEIGELVISLETAIKQAKQYRWSLEQEMRRLIIHGCLHLLGYDHEKVTKAFAEKMRREEKRIFKQINKI